ncbi:MAG: D-glycero-beta-D-manno-heptose 1,7-bisphosphate 7-phosphatase [Marinobacter sp.]|nr:D-glycero-beta-D-manno-heptose 1,7-bisphosphate 7-phosphatase [Marinobacter sp.]
MLIILDRDGVINQYHGQYICSLDEWIPLPGSIEAIARLCQAGHRIAIATNQSGLARGYYDEDTLNAMHQRLRTLVRAAGGDVAHIAYCPHHPDDGCDCRKPRTGLLEQIQSGLDLASLKGSVMVGDSRKDLLAGRKAGAATYLVRTGNGRETERNLGRRPLPGVEVFDDLQALTDHLLGTAAA